MPYLAGNGITPNAGLNALAQYAVAGGLITYMGIGTGCGALGGSALVSGTTYGSGTYNLPLAVALPSNLHVADYPKVRIMDHLGHSQDLTLASDATAGDTHLVVNAFTANANYAVSGDTVISPEPAATATKLYHEIARVAVDLTQGSVLAGPPSGEGVNAVYFNPTLASGTYCEFGAFGGAATAALNTGTLIFVDWSQYWAHVLNNDSATYGFDQLFAQA